MTSSQRIWEKTLPVLNGLWNLNHLRWTKIIHNTMTEFCMRRVSVVKFSAGYDTFEYIKCCHLLRTHFYSFIVWKSFKKLSQNSKPWLVRNKAPERWYLYEIILFLFFYSELVFFSWKIVFWNVLKPFIAIVEISVQYRIFGNNIKRIYENSFIS